MTPAANGLPVVVVSGWYDADPSPVVRSLIAERSAAVVHTGRTSFSSAVESVAVEEDVAWVDVCACCGVRLDLRRALRALAARREPPAGAIVEVAPGSDPSLVPQTLLGSHDLSRAWTQIASVVVLDAFPAATRAATGSSAILPGTMTDQLAVADIVTITGTGGLSARGVELVHVGIREINRHAAVLTAPSSRQLDAAIEARRALDLAERPPRYARWWHPARAEVVPDVGTVWLEVAGRLDSDRLDAWLHALHRDSAGELLRIEGVLAVASEPNRWRVRGVRQVLEVVDGEPWGDVVPSSRLMMVGRGLDPVTIEADLARCVTADGR